MNSIAKVSENTRRVRRRPSLAAGFATIALVLFSSTVYSAKSPPMPQKFRVTAVTAYTATVAWDPPKGNSGEFTYQLSGAYGVTPATLPKTATSYAFTSLHTNSQYWFYIFTRDSSGNTSGTASATTKTLLDTTPPTTGPGITVAEVGSNYVSVTLTPAQDDCPSLFYEISVNGMPVTSPDRSLSVTLRFLQPGTTYSLTARGRDEGNFWSPFSAPVSVTTLPANPNDHTAPTMPGNLMAYSLDGQTEMQIQWTQSTDDFDVQANIRYDVYVNGILDNILFGSGGPISAYGVFGGNTIEVIASDTADNASAPATTTINLP